MMFGQYPQDIAAGDENAARNPYNPSPDADFFDGALMGPLQGLESVPAKSINILGDVGEPFFKKAMKVITPPSLDMTDADYQKATDDWRENNLERVASLQPNPKTVGWLGRTGYGISAILPEAVGGFAAGGPAGAAATVGTMEGYTDFRLGQHEGLDTTTALRKGLITGATSAAGVIMPAGFGSGFLTKVATGATGNVLMGAGQRAATSKVLRDGGYDDMADQYKVLDAASLASDAILGAAFGTMTHKPSDIDASLMAKNVQNLEIDTAPGIPVDPATRDAHVQAVKTATEQLIKGETVDVSGVINDDMRFVPHEQLSEAESHNLMAEAFRNSGFDDHAQLAELLDEKPPAKSLLKFLADNGGVQDTGSELSTLNAQEWHKERPFQRMLIKENGLSPDAAALKAWEEGYFPTHQDRPTVNDLYNAVDAELRGQKIYPHGWTPEEKLLDEDFVAHHRELDAMYVEKLPEHLRDMYREASGNDFTHEEMMANLDDHLARAHDTLEKASIAGDEKAIQTAQKNITDAETLKAFIGDKESPQLSTEREKDILAQKPDMVITHDETGEPVRAADMLAEADKTVKEAQDTRDLFNAAVNCFLKWG